MPAPTWRNASACSNSSASMPLCRSASKAVMPPIPPPAIKTFRFFFWGKPATLRRNTSKTHSHWMRGLGQTRGFAEWRSEMTGSVKDMLAAANAAVPKIGPQDAAAMMKNGNVLVVDVRDGTELQAAGKVAGAKHVARGMIEFRADPESPYYDKDFNRDKTVIVYCASGGRAALAGKTLKDMGYKDV